MSDFYSNNNDYNNNYNNSNNYFDSQYSNGYDNGQAGFDQGYESGNPVVMNVKTLLAEEVIAKSFLFMFGALLITAFASLTTSVETAITLLSGSNYIIFIFAMLAVVIVSDIAISKNVPVLAGILYVVYSYMIGVMFSVIFLAYTTASITAVFFITAGLFAIMAIYGLVTKKDLSSVGSILLMGLIGIILAGFVNVFILQSTMVDTVICIIGILVFVGLTAYDTQKIKERVSYATDENVLSLALYGGFQLYLDFVNLFLKLLRLFGKRK